LSEEVAIPTGKTLWGKSWIKSLEVLDFHQNRLPRARVYVRRGNVESLHIYKNHIEASVRGATLYNLHFSLTPYTTQEQAQIRQLIEQHPDWSEMIRQKQLPEALAASIENLGIKFWPTGWDDLIGQCTCNDWLIPCKHLGALYYLLTEEIDIDPFLLFQLRNFDIYKALKKTKLPKDKKHKETFFQFSPAYLQADLSVLLQLIQTHQTVILSGIPGLGKRKLMIYFLKELFQKKAISNKQPVYILTSRTGTANWRFFIRQLAPEISYNIHTTSQQNNAVCQIITPDQLAILNKKQKTNPLYWLADTDALAQELYLNPEKLCYTPYQKIILRHTLPTTPDSWSKHAVIHHQIIEPKIAQELAGLQLIPELVRATPLQLHPDFQNYTHDSIIKIPVSIWRMLTLPQPNSPEKIMPFSGKWIRMVLLIETLLAHQQRIIILYEDAGIEIGLVKLIQQVFHNRSIYWGNKQKQSTIKKIIQKSNLQKDLAEIFVFSIQQLSEEVTIPRNFRIILVDNLPHSNNIALIQKYLQSKGAPLFLHWLITADSPEETILLPKLGNFDPL
jgi:uncharacterized Zn finger protein/DNA polymerase III psi subunit